MYRVIKWIRTHPYLYEQESYRVGEKVRTRNRCLGRASPGDVIRYSKPRKGTTNAVEVGFQNLFGEQRITAQEPFRSQEKLSPQAVFELQNPPPTSPTRFEGLHDLTLKTLELLKGKAKVSRQFIEDLLRKPDIKQIEKDLIRSVLHGMEGKKIPVALLAERVRLELLDLDVREVNPTRHEECILPESRHYGGDDYAEIIYETPFETSAKHHFGSESSCYLAHVRYEDLHDGTRRILEVQSDLFQRRNNIQRPNAELPEDEREGMEQLFPYRNTWHERILREEIRRAALDGVRELLFPTGETVAYIENFVSKGDADNRLTEDSVPGDCVSVYGNESLVVSLEGHGAWIVPEHAIQQCFDWHDIKEEEIDYLCEEIADDPSAFTVIEEGTELTEEEVRALAEEEFDSRFSPSNQPHAWTQEMCDSLGQKHLVMDDHEDNPTILVVAEDHYHFYEYGEEEEEYHEGKLSDSQRRVVNFYENEIPKVLRQLKPDTTMYEDDNGYEWFSVPIVPKGELDPDTKAVHAFRSQGRKRIQPGNINREAEKRARKKY